MVRVFREEAARRWHVEPVQFTYKRCPPNALRSANGTSIHSSCRVGAIDEGLVTGAKDRGKIPYRSTRYSKESQQLDGFDP